MNNIRKKTPEEFHIFVILFAFTVIHWEKVHCGGMIDSIQQCDGGRRRDWKGAVRGDELQGEHLRTSYLKIYNFVLNFLSRQYIHNFICLFFSNLS